MYACGIGRGGEESRRGGNAAAAAAAACDTAIYNRVRASCLSVAALAAPSAGCCIAGQTRERRSTAWRLAASAYLLGVLMTERLLHIWTGR